MLNKKALTLLELASIALIFITVIIVNKSNYIKSYNLLDHDIYYEFNQAIEIKDGINPYQRILRGDLYHNNKYATLLPSYYYFLLGIAAFSQFTFKGFVDNYRSVLLLFEFIGFGVIYLKFRENDQKALGLFAASFFLLNRWTIGNVALLKQDVIAITLLLLSLYFLDKKTRLAYLFFGLSLAIKHLGLLALPIYIAPLLFKKRSLKDFLLDILVMLFPIMSFSIIYLIWNFKAFIYSMLFSITRKNDSTTGSITTGYENLLTDSNMAFSSSYSMFSLLIPRLPLLVFSVFNLVLYFAKKINWSLYIMFAFIVFVALNPVYFDQYITWITPLIAFTALDWKKSNTNS
ncbi:MAG TPA: hypothetical protein VLI92_04120 [Candidatus Saccharimonadales bacterium]|nr:hypothetical protein [Candidatus Saccharimonadales bacterium]